MAFPTNTSHMQNLEPPYDGMHLFRALADSISQLVCIVLPSGKLDFVNRRYSEFAGSASVVEEAWQYNIHPEDRPLAAKLWSEATALFKPFRLECRLRNRDGEYQMFQMKFDPRANGAGNIEFWIAICSPLETQAKHSRELIAAVHEGIVHGSDDLIAAQDSNFRFVYFNDSYREKFESLWGKELHMGASLFEVLADWPDELEKARLLWGRAHAGESFHLVMEFGPSNSLRRTFMLRYNAVFNQHREQIGAAHVIRDVTDEVRIEQALRASEERFRTLADAMPQLVWTASRDGMVNYYNRQYSKYAGIESRSDGTWKWQPVVHDADLDATVAAWNHAVQTGSMYQCEHRIRMADEGFRWHLSRAHLSGTPGAATWFGTATDIHDLKVAQAAIQESEERFRLMADGLPLPVWVHSADGEQQFVNQTFCDCFGVTRDEMRGSAWRELMHPEDIEAYAQEFNNCMRTHRQFHGQVRARRADGQWRWFESWARPRFSSSGDFLGMVGVSADTTERRKGEERARLLSEAAAVLLNTNSPHEMLRGVFGKIAPHLELDAYLNYVVDESGTALKLASWEGVSQELVDRVKRLNFGEALCGLAAVNQRSVVVCHIQQSNDPRVQHAKASGIRAIACSPLLSGRELVGTLSFSSTIRDEFDESELEFMRSICQYVAAAYDRLRLVDRLRLADRRKDEFLATLAHELRNPLAPIRSGLEVLRLSADEPELIAETQMTMGRQLAHLVALVDDLLDVSRISNGKFKLRAEQVALENVIRDAVNICKPVIELAEHHLDIQQPTDSVFLDGDPHRLSQILSNLINNAAKYTPPRGELKVHAHVEQGHAIISVKDNGIGIQQDQLHRVFELFTQIEKPEASGYMGLGIGLSLVKSLVEMHGGSITVTSEGTGKGATFVVRIPIASSFPVSGSHLQDAIPEVSAKQTSPAQVDARPQRRKVLVVDDNYAAAKTLSIVIRKMGNEVLTAADGHAAVEAAREFAPDLVIMDIGMPVMDGYEAARAIRAAPWGKQMILVALTGWGQDEDIQRSEAAGFNSHVVKPVEPDSIRRLLAELPQTIEEP